MTTPTTTLIDGVELPAPGTFVLEPNHTTLGFVARHLMVTKVRGHFAEFEGSITIAGEPHASTADVTIKTASVETGTADRDNHLRSGDFFEAEKYPEITFHNARVTSQKGTDFTVVGDLTIKDVTREVELAVELDGVVKDPFGGTRLAVTATTEVDREDWGMTWNAALETGGVLVGKDVTITLDLQGALQQD